MRRMMIILCWCINSKRGATVRRKDRREEVIVTIGKPEPWVKSYSPFFDSDAYG